MKRRPIAIVAAYQTPLKEAADSAKNFMLLVADKMYGTPARARATVGCAILLTVLAMIFSSPEVHALAVCTN